jgi:hypothetical protein
MMRMRIISNLLRAQVFHLTSMLVINRRQSVRMRTEWNKRAPA